MAIRYSNNSIMYWLKVGQRADLAANQPTPQAMYAALEMYYLNNGVYDAIQQESFENGLWTEAMKGFRNPAHRTVEFYVSKIWPGALPEALPILTDNPKIIEPIHQVWTWSNWGVNKQLAARWFSMLGDMFIKISTRAEEESGEVERIYMKNIKPEFVTDLDLDERGFLTYIRLDIPQATRKPDGKMENWEYTEVWDKATGTFRTWKHDKNPETELEQLGEPTRLEYMEEAFGFDFIPFVHAKFSDIGDVRGVGAFTHALDKIDEANRQATRLHQIIFRYNKATWALSANGVDANMRPLPPPRVGRDNDGTDGDGEVLNLGDDTLLSLPGTSKLESLIPNINYDAALSILNAQMKELEHDLPELAYYRLREMGTDISGRAVRLLLSDAVDRAEEARGNAETALQRADEMALTIGKVHSLFKDVGEWEAGDFEHRFASRPIIPVSEKEKAEEVTGWVGAGIPLVTALRLSGWSDEDIKEMEEEKAKEEKASQEKLAQQRLTAMRDFDRGGEEVEEDDTFPQAE